MTEHRETGPSARKARRNLIRNTRRKEAKQHGTPIPDPPQTTRMIIPDHIQALEGETLEDR